MQQATPFHHLELPSLKTHRRNVKHPIAPWDRLMLSQPTVELLKTVPGIEEYDTAKYWHHAVVCMKSDGMALAKCQPSDTSFLHSAPNH